MNARSGQLEANTVVGFSNPLAAATANPPAAILARKKNLRFMLRS